MCRFSWKSTTSSPHSKILLEANSVLLPIRGATLTLSKCDGDLLTAFLALFVAGAGRSFWRLFCLATHTILSTATARDGLYHQRQAVLRNADGSLNGLKQLIQLAWHWRQKAKRLWCRTLPLIGFTLLLIVAFQVAVIFSSQVRIRR